MLKQKIKVEQVYCLPLPVALSFPSQFPLT